MDRIDSTLASVAITADTYGHLLTEDLRGAAAELERLAVCD